MIFTLTFGDLAPIKLRVKGNRREAWLRMLWQYDPFQNPLGVR